tara:strand:- start:399 stop:632 length:234 start_codon:yes stop_codon:yes gene_type:complete
MIRRMVNGKSPIKSPRKSLIKSPIKSPRIKKINNKKNKASQILKAMDKLTQLESQLKAELVHIRKQKSMLYNSLRKL